LRVVNEGVVTELGVLFRTQLAVAGMVAYASLIIVLPV
jgi:hypothetical protein